VTDPRNIGGKGCDACDKTGFVLAKPHRSLTFGKDFVYPVYQPCPACVVPEEPAKTIPEVPMPKDLKAQASGEKEDDSERL